jgi:hypothetical protein
VFAAFGLCLSGLRFGPGPACFARVRAGAFAELPGAFLSTFGRLLFGI